MQSEAYKILRGLPAKVGAGTCTAIGTVANLLPEDRLSQMVAPYLSVENARLTGLILLAMAACYFALLWVLKPSTGDAAVEAREAVHNHGILLQDNASFQNTGTMNFVQGVKHKSLQAGIFDGLSHQSGTVIVRVHNSTSDRLRLAEQLHDALIAIGLNAIIQTGYHGHDFEGLVVRPAPNATARLIASLVHQRLTQNGVTAAIAEEQLSWGAEHYVLIEIGSP